MVLKPIQELQTEIKKILIKEFDNVELKRLLNKRFVEKGFTPKTITLLFESIPDNVTICPASVYGPESPTDFPDTITEFQFSSEVFKPVLFTEVAFIPISLAPVVNKSAVAPPSCI